MNFSNRRGPTGCRTLCGFGASARCNSVKFKPAELRSIDGLLVMIALRPVRCMFCWRRLLLVQRCTNVDRSGHHEIRESRRT
jgi:hypothetical protein